MLCTYDIMSHYYLIGSKARPAHGFNLLSFALYTNFWTSLVASIHPGPVSTEKNDCISNKSLERDIRGLRKRPVTNLRLGDLLGCPRYLCGAP